jgi:hypothetical protein
MLPVATIVALLVSAISIFGIARSNSRPLTSSERGAGSSVPRAATCSPLNACRVPAPAGPGPFA